MSSVSVVDSTGAVLPLVSVIVTPSVSSSVVVAEIVLSASASYFPSELWASLKEIVIVEVMSPSSKSSFIQVTVTVRAVV